MSEKRLILVIDDQKELFEILQKLLNKKDIDLEYRRAEDSLVYIESNPKIDLIIMDIMMPQINGYDLTKQIRTMNLDYYIPIIMLTAKTELNDLIKGFESGADDYVTKPFEFSELIARINSCIRRSEKEFELNGHKTQMPMDVKALRSSYDEKNKELEKKIFYLKNLIEMSYELHSVLDLNKLINIAIFALISHLGCKNAAIFLETDPIESSVLPVNSKGFFEEAIRNIQLSKHTALSKHFEFSDKPELVSQLISIPKLKEEADVLKNNHVELIAPIRNGAHLEGFLLLGSRIKNKPYKEDDIYVINMFSSMLAVAIANASMYEKIKELSYTDGMTGLHNYRYFELRLAEELSRAARNKMYVTLIIIDVDFFKNYNDTLGHQAGDEALRIMGRIMKNSVRTVDIPVRYGGEEFAVILPNVNREGAMIFANRLRKRVEETPFPKEEVQPLGKLTCSIGVSIFPEDSTEMEDLIYKADLCLYKAKREGRNRVIVYDESVIETPSST